MWWTGRRAFLKSLCGAFPILLVPPALWPLDRADLDPARLRAVADVVLPSRLGAEGAARIVERFRDWLAGYRAGAERSHGYGSGSMEIRHLPPDPAPRWEAHLEELDGIARRRFGVAFGELPLDQRGSILRERLTGAAASASPENADHVAIGLMSFYFNSAEAADLAYGGVIAKETCRSLDTVGERPSPVGREERR